MEQPLVSIIIVSYNHGKFLKENLDSIKAQTYPNIQLIVADDASMDNSVQVFEEWLKENNYPATKNFHKKNTGLATTLNECIEHVKGKYVKMIAADDYLHPESIEKCVEELERLGEEYGMVFTDTWTINEKSEITNDITDYNVNKNLTKEQFREKLLEGNRIAALTVLMRKTAVKNTGDYPTDLFIEDYYRWLKINEQYWIAYLPDKLSYYRLHSSNISKIRADKILEEEIMMKLLFDKTGAMKTKIENFIVRKYYQKKISKKIEELYTVYKYRDRILNFCIIFNLPFLIYRILNKIF